jgi:sugar phosphate isomerase/epimerase
MTKAHESNSMSLDRRQFFNTGLAAVLCLGFERSGIGAGESPAMAHTVENIKNTGKSVKIGCRLEMVPGEGVLSKVINAKEYGFEGVSLPGRFLKDYITDLKKVKTELPLPLISLSLGFEGSLVSPDIKSREKCRYSLLNLFDLCNELNINILNMPPVLIQDNPERYKEEKVQDELLIKQLFDICEEGRKHNVRLLLEPVNRYETNYLTTLSHTIRICNTVNHDYLGITADFYHMMLEELNIPEAIKNGKKWIKHVHVAENTRVEPGPGSQNFKPGFKALKENGYNGFIEIECRSLSGDPEIVYPKSIKYLRNIWHSA